MGVILPKSMFFHVPKTGGTWVQESLFKSVDGAVKFEAYLGNPDSRLDGIHTPTNTLNHKDKKAFCFVRHPLEWYKSLWRYELGEDGRWPKNNSCKFDRTCPHRQFPLFIDAVIENFPDGYFNKIVREFIDGADYVGKQETLYFDLLDFLDDIGEDYDGANIHSQHINVSPTNNKAVYAKGQKEKILEIEKFVVKEFYE